MEGGVATVSFATGMAAIGAVMLTLVRAGDHVVASRYLFGNTASLFQTLEAHGIAVSFVDATDADDVAAAITPRRGSCSSRRSRTRARRSPTLSASARCARVTASCTSSTTR
jgi:hypothetical protein